ncbi:MAG: peptidoglycan DD-metalloendopeptidase family protein [Bacteroidetes bacterium]|jgi:murein DD-endopeptidase MepM/ murein hydrolase activator NlpD|nr:peptidoglycan DD-metalloendopeptidase family protein [Bacteroidota bacterium]
MWTFLSDLADHWRTTLTVLVMNEESSDPARRHEVRPNELGWLWLSTLGAAVVLTTCLIAFTPIRTLIPGYGTEAVQRSAQLSAMRVSALRDSLTVQRRYIERLQQLMTGRVEPRSGARAEADPAPEPGARPRPMRQAPDAGSESHDQPAMAVTSFPASGAPASAANNVDGLPSLRMPLTPPVETGFPTRGFNAREGHYAIDIAVEAGSYVYSVGDGYVIFADWTNDGGYTIAVQHADGYLSVYKHNQRLVKRIGDRVRQQEAVAVSGNSGEITTGPHLHFELWHHGLAQDPRPLFEGW